MTLYIRYIYVVPIYRLYLLSLSWSPQPSRDIPTSAGFLCHKATVYGEAMKDHVGLYIAHGMYVCVYIYIYVRLYIHISMNGRERPVQCSTGNFLQKVCTCGACMTISVACYRL